MVIKYVKIRNYEVGPAVPRPGVRWACWALSAHWLFEPVEQAACRRRLTARSVAGP